MQEEIVLCNEKSERLSVYVTASLNEAKLTVCGVDCGQFPETFWGCDDYEYWYTFDEENTALLFQIICPHDGNRLTALKERFNGRDACRRLREFCDSVGIIYRFDSWI